jgi:hypothetical protein
MEKKKSHDTRDPSFRPQRIKSELRVTDKIQKPNPAGAC